MSDFDDDVTRTMDDAVQYAQKAKELTAAVLKDLSADDLESAEQRKGARLTPPTS